MHEGMDPKDIENILYQFENGSNNILISKSILALDIDFKNIVLVINYDCPNTLIDYIYPIQISDKNKAITIAFNA